MHKLTENAKPPSQVFRLIPPRLIEYEASYHYMLTLIQFLLFNVRRRLLELE